MQLKFPSWGWWRSWFFNWDWWMGRNPKIVTGSEAKNLRLAVTVVIPAHDEESLIAETIASIRAQTYPVCELIVVADNCSDNTAVCARRAGADTVIINPPDEHGKSTKSRAQNAALLHIKTPLFVTVDADTTLAPNAIGKMIPYFNDERTFAVSGYVISKNIIDYVARQGDIKRTTAALKSSWLALKRVGNPAWKEVRTQWRKYKKENSLTVWELGRFVEYIHQLTVVKPAQNHIDAVLVASGCACAFRTDMVRELGGFDSRVINEDMFITWLAKLRKWRVWYEPESICYPLEPDTPQMYIQQDDRWYRGTFQCIKAFRYNLFPLGKTGLFTYYYVLSGISGPFLTILSLFWLANLGWITDWKELVVAMLVGQLVNYVGGTWLWILIPARKLGMSSLAVRGFLHGFVTTQYINQFVYLRAAVLEIILSRKLDTWNKGHGEHSRFGPTTSAEHA